MTLEEIKALAYLARLELSAEELLRITGELSSILSYADHIQQVDVEGVEPLAHPLGSTNAWRDDELSSSLPLAESLQNAPKKLVDARSGGGFFLVPAVLD
jgi:aspartyl-tRNA(Asn)/glutamyl-tRNA(Gln) amidotransferase subunit C